MATTAGYSVTPLAKKLGVKEGQRVCLVGAPDGWLVAEVSKSVDLRTRIVARADLVVLFCADSAALARRVSKAADAIFPNGAVWVSWPRKAAGHSSDLDENGIRARCLPMGLVDVKVAALSEDWSGLKLVWRKDRRGERQGATAPK